MRGAHIFNSFTLCPWWLIVPNSFSCIPYLERSAARLYVIWAHSCLFLCYRVKSEIDCKALQPVKRQNGVCYRFLLLTTKTYFSFLKFSSINRKSVGCGPLGCASVNLFIVQRRRSLHAQTSACLGGGGGRLRDFCVLPLRKHKRPNKV
ncbi:hypothetical protein, unlikely [Trypanosoma brucei brucei TREU927]|uniref:Secreted protein n=1 Tax=Trypanosoma brucei brucei (strain 927/4 GUTat10.1) TaxID=185431 RepID=Q4GZA0_TRYB2|nr:hypothetical protein, unlikely [Trypanosoma brucei brucei TREU927]CAJ16063.1 hypothetical protein, unlikely [Trypanosoma brucei brucei TREU927]